MLEIWNMIILSHDKGWSVAGVVSAARHQGLLLLIIPTTLVP